MSNEDKILAMLETLTEKVDKQGEQLAQQGEQLARQGEQLVRQGEQLARVKEQLQDLDDRFVRAALIQENEILPKIQVLFENQGTILDKLDTKATEERVEDLESDMRIVKGAVTRLRQDVDELKKAQ